MSDSFALVFDRSALNLLYADFLEYQEKYNKMLEIEWNRVHNPEYFEAYQKYCDLGLHLRENDDKLVAYLATLSHDDKRSLGRGIRLLNKKEFEYRYLLFEMQDGLRRDSEFTGCVCDKSCKDGCNEWKCELESEQRRLGKYRAKYALNEPLCVLLH